MANKINFGLAQMISDWFKNDFSLLNFVVLTTHVKKVLTLSKNNFVRGIMISEVNSFTVMIK